MVDEIIKFGIVASAGYIIYSIVAAFFFLAPLSDMSHTQGLSSEFIEGQFKIGMNWLHRAVASLILLAFIVNCPDISKAVIEKFAVGFIEFADSCSKPKLSSSSEPAPIKID